MSLNDAYSQMQNISSSRRPSMCVFIGKSRPFLPNDTGKVLLQELTKQGFSIEGVFFYPNDPLKEWAKDNYPVYLVPNFLRGSFGQMSKYLRENGPDPQFQTWLTWFTNKQFTQGFVFFAGWIPPHIFTSFPHGMVNYHPGPLPELPGYEPETMAVLLGLDRFYGTMHVVDEIFDNGELLWYSPSIPIKPSDGPVSILYRTTIKACTTIPKALDSFYRGVLSKPKVSGRSVVVYASRKACRNFSVIDWQRDGVETILRKNRAFNEQEISLNLLCHAFGSITTVMDAVSADNILRKLFIKKIKQFGYKKPLPGSQIGVYQGPGRFKGAPVFKTLTGNIMLLCEPQDQSVLVKHAKRARLYHSKPAQQLEKIL